jgi:uncharacterized RmlC-like cupin family protein
MNTKNLEILTVDDAVTITKDNQTTVSYYIFKEYEIHLNTLPINSIQEWHYHRDIEEVIVVTNGVLTCWWKKDGQIYAQDVKKGQVIRVANSIHTLENRSDKDVSFIVFRLVLTDEDKREIIKHDKVIVD